MKLCQARLSVPKNNQLRAYSSMEELMNQISQSHDSIADVQAHFDAHKFLEPKPLACRNPVLHNNTYYICIIGMHVHHTCILSTYDVH